MIVIGKWISILGGGCARNKQTDWCVWSSSS